MIGLVCSAEDVCSVVDQPNTRVVEPKEEGIYK